MLLKASQMLYHVRPIRNKLPRIEKDQQFVACLTPEAWIIFLLLYLFLLIRHTPILNDRIIYHWCQYMTVLYQHSIWLLVVILLMHSYKQGMHMGSY